MLYMDLEKIEKMHDEIIQQNKKNIRSAFIILIIAIIMYLAMSFLILDIVF